MKKTLVSAVWFLVIGLFFSALSHAGGLHYRVSTSSLFYADDAANLVGIRMNWVYDPEVSAVILDGRDTSAAGLQQLAQDMIADLHELGYFARLKLDGEPLPIAKASDFSIQLTTDQSLQLGLQLPLQEVVDVSGKTLSLTLADPDGTANMIYTGVDRIALEDELAAKCGSPVLQAETLDMGGHELVVQTVSVPCQ